MGSSCGWFIAEIYVRKRNRKQIFSILADEASDSNQQQLFVVIRLQRNNNAVSESISDYFKKVVTIPLLDHFTIEIERIKMVLLVYKNVDWKEKFNSFANLFKDYFPWLKVLEAEPDLWEWYCLKSKDYLPDSISSTWNCIPFNVFNKIKVSIKNSSYFSCNKMHMQTVILCYKKTLKIYATSAMVSERLNEQSSGNSS